MTKIDKINQDIETARKLVKELKAKGIFPVPALCITPHGVIISTIKKTAIKK